MTPEEYFDSQAYFNKNLKEMTETDRAHIIAMLGEFSAIKIEEFTNQVYIP